MSRFRLEVAGPNDDLELRQLLAATPMAAQSSGFIIAVGRPSRFCELGVSVKVEFRKVRAGAATSRNGLSSVALSISR